MKVMPFVTGDVEAASNICLQELIDRAKSDGISLISIGDAPKAVGLTSSKESNNEGDTLSSKPAQGMVDMVITKSIIDSVKENASLVMKLARIEHEKELLVKETELKLATKDFELKLAKKDDAIEDLENELSETSRENKSLTVKNNKLQDNENDKIQLIREVNELKRELEIEKRARAAVEDEMDEVKKAKYSLECKYNELRGFEAV